VNPYSFRVILNVELTAFDSESVCRFEDAMAAFDAVVEMHRMFDSPTFVVLVAVQDCLRNISHRTHHGASRHEEGRFPLPSMVSTLQLSALVQQARDAGAKVHLVGDPGQLDAIDAGGILGWLDRQGKTVRLSTIWRFEQASEQDASLKLRAGDFAAIADYDRHRRIQHGSYLDMVDQAYLSWQSDIQEGKSSILIAADNDTASMLNQRAQADRVIQGAVDAEHAAPLSDGSQAGTGDTVIARHNDRTITDSSGDFIRNGTMLDVVRTGRRDGSLTAVRRDTGATVTLGRGYVSASVELGYATTAHRSPGRMPCWATGPTRPGRTDHCCAPGLSKASSRNPRTRSRSSPEARAQNDISDQPINSG
jgi:hypothetical protein